MTTKIPATGLVPTGQPPQMDSVDGVRVGEEPVPGMRLRCICRGHQGAIGRIAWSPCGRFIASPSRDKTIRIWDANSGQCLAVLKGHEGTVYGAAWSYDGATLASASWDGTVGIWNTCEQETPKLSRKVEAGYANCVGWSWRLGKDLLAIGAEEPTVDIWDRKSQQVVDSLRGHIGNINNLSWSPTGRMLAAASGDKSVSVWNMIDKKQLYSLRGHAHWAFSVAWSPDEHVLASGSWDGTVGIWHLETGRQVQSLEGHESKVSSTSFSRDGQVLASKAADGSVRLWRTDAFQLITTLAESSSGRNSPGLSFHPLVSILATLGEQDCVIRVWDIDIDELLGRKPKVKIVSVTSAKIALLGESNVGKSCLAMRLAEDRYPEDHEHATTHGMRFWPMAAESPHRVAKPSTGQRRDVVLWDFGGQDEYQLVHQMFLHDTTLAVVLIDPTRGRAAMDEARDWNNRLEKHLGGRQAAKLLVGAKQDRASRLVHRTAVEQLCRECGFAGYIETSAKTGRNCRQLRKVIATALDWDSLAKTSRPELFQRIRDQIETQRKSGEVVLLLDDLRRLILQDEFSDEAVGGEFEDVFRSVRAVAEQLAKQGVIVLTKLLGGDEAVVLQLPVIERYAGSLIVAARNNPRGVPVLEERLLGSPKLPLPGMKKKDRVPRLQEKIVLECVAELMIQHGICFRHDGLLVFPTLFLTVDAGGMVGDRIPHSVSLFYDFTGAIDNIYASLVARLIISEEFGKGRLWPGRVEFDQPGQGVCGIRRIKRTGGLAHIDLFFAEETAKERRNLLTRFVEDHLRQQGVEIREHQAIKCRGCERELGEDIVHANIAAGEKDVVCPYCRTHTLISEGVARIRERDPQSDQKIYALRKSVDERTAEDAKSAKKAVAKSAELAERPTAAGEPVRLLHLSDLHFSGQASPKAKLQWLLQDLRKADGPFPKVETVEYLVISGDMTDKGGEEGFERAREFVGLLIEELKLSPLRCMLVPGNHDVQDLKTSYEWWDSAAGVDAGCLVKQGDIYLVRSDELYHQRLKKFSDAFYHKVMASESYPLQTEEQGRACLFPETRIQFLTLNSCWQIDQFHRKRSGVHPGAVGNAIEHADKEVADAVKRGDLKKGASILRFAVWHHAAAGPEMMQDVSFISNLRKAGVKVCLHGDVHEMRCELIGYRQADGQVHVIGAGSFGSPAEGRPEATPRLYNLLEIQPDLSSIRVHTRQQRAPDGAWEGWYEWPDPDGGQGRVAFFDIDLK